MGEIQEFRLILLTPRIAMSGVFVSLPNVRPGAIGNVFLQFLTSLSKNVKNAY
jgi:hypothetical protein